MASIFQPVFHKMQDNVPCEQDSCLCFRQLHGECVGWSFGFSLWEFKNGHPHFYLQITLDTDKVMQDPHSSPSTYTDFQNTDICPRQRNVLCSVLPSRRHLVGCALGNLVDLFGLSSTASCEGRDTLLRLMDFTDKHCISFSALITQRVS